jgi:alpha-L-fucosidase
VFHNRLIKKARLGSPVVESSPAIWRGRLYLLECWQRRWDDEPGPQELDYIQIRDVEQDQIAAKCMEGYGLASAFVWDDRFHIFAAQHKDGAHHNVNMCFSADLVHWSEPRVVIEEDPGEDLFNQSVCHDGHRFVMAYESDDPAYPRFTLKFAESLDLRVWRKIPGLIYGPDRYVACPAIRCGGGYYYMLYLERVAGGFETYLTRSKDLLRWEQAPHNPVITFDPAADCHPLFYERRDPMRTRKECNASDPDLVEWQGKTRVYFTGGCQRFAGDLQYAEFDGPMQEFFESYYQG